MSNFWSLMFQQSESGECAIPPTGSYCHFTRPARPVSNLDNLKCIKRMLLSDCMLTEIAFFQHLYFIT